MPQRALNCDGLNFTSPTLRPIRGATVEIVDATNNAVLGTDVTDASGDYAATVDPNTDVFVRVRSELKQAGSPSWDVEVRNNTLSTNLPLAQRPLYFLDSATFNTGAADSTRDVLGGTGWTGMGFGGTRAAAPFAVMDTIYAMLQMVVTEADPTVNFPPLDAFWSPDNRTTPGTGNLLDDIDAGNIGLSFFVGGSIGAIVILGEDGGDFDEFDTHIIAHEWGHYLEDRLSRSDSLGGPHSFTDQLDMRLAFGEGFGQAIAGMGLDEPVYCDALWAGGALRGFGFNLEDIQNLAPMQTLGTRGWFNEFSIAMLLYDLWDNDNDGADSMSIGFAPIYAVLTDEQSTTDALTTVFSFFAALKSLPNAETAFIDGLLAQENIVGPGISPFGVGETNDGGATPGTDVLPIYTDIALTATEQVCVSNQFNFGRFGNYLSNSRFLRLDLAQTGPVTITVDTVNPPTTPTAGFDCTASVTDPQNRTHSDPDVNVWRDGLLVGQGVSCEPNQEIGTTGSLTPGTYVIELVEFRHDDPGTVNPGNFSQVCFDITVSP